MVEGTPRCLGGEGNLPLAAAPPSRSHLLGSAPPLAPLHIVGGRGGISHQPLAPPSSPLRLSLVVSAKPCCCDALHPPPRRRAAGSSSTSPSPLLDQEGGDVSRPVRVLNAEVLSVQHLVIGDSNHVEYDYIITLQASARDLQVVCRCKLSPLTRCLDELIDGSW